MVRSARRQTVERKFKIACKRFGAGPRVNSELEFYMNLDNISETIMDTYFGSLPQPSNPTFEDQAREALLNYLGTLEGFTSASAAGFASLIEQMRHSELLPTSPANPLAAPMPLQVATETNGDVE